ncbi:hypothetical protein [Hydrogenophaga sp.]|uniref:hypothetical protein n=1 Tax=Hydrogenophaga sp. TaxID=1904254 RepID=UPI003F724593
MKDFFSGALGLVMVFGMLGVGIFMLAIGWAGIEHQFGFWWGVAAVAGALLFKFTLPLSVGAFFCAYSIWGWHWAFALLLAAPGLIFMIPGLVAAMAGAFRQRRG